MVISRRVKRTMMGYWHPSAAVLNEMQRRYGKAKTDRRVYHRLSAASYRSGNARSGD